MVENHKDHFESTVIFFSPTKTYSQFRAFFTHSECTETKCVISKVGKPAYEWGKTAAVNQIKNYIDGKLLEIAWIFTL